MDYYLEEDLLYKRSFDWTLLKCLNEKKKKVVQSLQEIHQGIYVILASKHTMTRQMQRSGYFWLTMKRDYVNYVRKYHKC
jgi:hypothetical protein